MAHIIPIEVFLYGKCNPLEVGCVWIETYPCGLAPAFFDLAHRGDVRFLSLYFVQSENNFSWWPEKYYGMTWRCWDEKPTEEEREKTPWLEVKK